MNDFNGETKKLINELSFEQNITFALTCINRLKQLPKIIINSGTYAIQYLEETQNISPNTIENILNEITDKINKETLDIKNDEIEEKMEMLEKLCVDTEEDGSTEGTLFLNYLIILRHILLYIKDRNCEDIYWCSNNFIDIVDAMEYEKYYKGNENCDDKKIDKYIDLMTKNEMEKQRQIIKIIKEGHKKILVEYVEENKIEYYK